MRNFKTNLHNIRKIASISLLFSMLVCNISIMIPSSAYALSKDEKELFLVAQKAFDDGFYDVAIRYIDQFVNLYPQSEQIIQAKILLGQCHFFKNQYLKAFEIFQDLLQFSDYQDATLFWLGETYFKGADYTQAIIHYKKLIEEYPDSIYLPQAYYSLAWTYFEQSDYENAKLIFQTLLTKYPAHQLSEDSFFKLGECEHNLENFEVSMDYFKKYIIKYPQSTRQAEAYFYIAEANYYLKNYLHAITYYAKSADIAYDHNLAFMAKISMGWSYLKLEKYDLADRAFTDAEKIAESQNIRSDDIFLGRASLYSAIEENEKALEAYSSLINEFPNSSRLADAYLGKANIEYTIKNYTDAIDDYKWIIDKYANNRSQAPLVEKAFYGLAWTFLKSGDIDSSIRTFELIKDKTKSSVVKVSALTQIGDAYQEIEKYQKAIDIYDRILKNYPNSIYIDYVQFRQGIALLKLNKLEAATLSFKSLKTNFPNSKYAPDIDYYLGVAYYKKGDWLQSIQHIKEYLNSEKTSDLFTTEANYILALSNFNLSNYAEALSFFQKIVKSPSSKSVMIRNSKFNIAKCLYHLGQTQEALKKFRTIANTFPDTLTAQDALLWVGDHYLKSSHYEDAINIYLEFLNNYPGSEKINLIYFELGQAYQALGQIENALNYYRHITDPNDTEIFAKAKLAIADIFALEADDEKTIETYLNITTSAPDFKRDAYVKLAGVYKRNNQLDSALDAYQNALKGSASMSDIKDSELYFYIGDMYEIMHNTEKAIDTYIKIPYLFPDDNVYVIKSYLRVARIFEDSEKWDDAILTYRKIIDMNVDESKYAEERILWINQNILQTESTNSQS